MEAALRESLPVPLFPVLFVGIWLAVTLLLSRLGWHLLARRYRSSSPFPDRLSRFQSGTFNGAGYKYCLSVRGSEAEHPRLFIRSREIVVIEEKKFLAWAFAGMRFPGPGRESPAACGGE